MQHCEFFSAHTHALQTIPQTQMLGMFGRQPQIWEYEDTDVANIQPGPAGDHIRRKLIDVMDHWQPPLHERLEDLGDLVPPGQRIRMYRDHVFSDLKQRCLRINKQLHSQGCPFLLDLSTQFYYLKHTKSTPWDILRSLAIIEWVLYMKECYFAALRKRKRDQPVIQIQSRFITENEDVSLLLSQNLKVYGNIRHSMRKDFAQAFYNILTAHDRIDIEGPSMDLRIMTHQTYRWYMCRVLIHIFRAREFK